MAKEQDGGKAQRLLDTAHARQEALKTLEPEREATVVMREAIVEAIRRDSVYQRTMEVLNDPVLDQLLPLFWGVWNPIKLVSKDVTTETPIEIAGRVLFRTKTIRTVEEEGPAPYRDPRRVLPLDPVGFVNQCPVDRTLFGVRGIAPITAYLRSIGLTTIEEDTERRFPPKIGFLYGAYVEKIAAIRRYLPQYGGGSCGFIELKTPAAPGRMGDQGRLRIEAGYDLQSEGFLIKLSALGPPFDVVETFTSLAELQEKLAELLVENGVSAVE